MSFVDTENNNCTKEIRSCQFKEDDSNFIFNLNGSEYIQSFTLFYGAVYAYGMQINTNERNVLALPPVDTNDVKDFFIWSENEIDI